MNSAQESRPEQMIVDRHRANSPSLIDTAARATASVVTRYIVSAGLFLLFFVLDTNYVTQRFGAHWADGIFWPGSDTRIYFRAAEAWLAGGDPYTAMFGGIAFGAPPPTLLAVAPFVPFGEPFTVTLWFVGLPLLGWLALRRVGLPVWWLLWPPFFEALWVGSLDVVVILALVSGATVLASVVKSFAVVPAILLGRWRALTWTGAVLLVTAPFLPWPAFLDHGLGIISSQNKGYSAWRWLPLVPAVAVSLVILGREKAAWLAVPALWPFTQLHYSLVALPAMTPLLAVFMSFRDPWAVSVGIVLSALGAKRSAARTQVSDGAERENPAMAAGDSIAASIASDRYGRISDAVDRQPILL